jgi:hypothetical protein
MRALYFSVVLAMVGCAGTPSTSDAGHDAAHDVVDALVAADAPFDAGVSDADRVDAFVAPIGCAGRSYLFCEDFESASGTDLPTGWVVGSGWMDGNPSVTSSVAHTGTRALRSASAMSGQHRAEHPLAALGDARGHHWGRVFYRVATPAFVPSSGVVHNTMLGLLGSTECRVVDTVESTAAAHQFLFNIPDDSCCVGSSYDYHSYDDAWHCAEWYVDASTQGFRFFFDGAEVTSLAFTRADDHARVREIGGGRLHAKHSHADDVFARHPGFGQRLDHRRVFGASLRQARVVEHSSRVAHGHELG